MIALPIIRHGKAYQSLDNRDLFNPKRGENFAKMSLANSGLMRLDAQKDHLAAAKFRGIPTRQVLAMLEEAAEYFVSDTLPFGPQGERADFGRYLELLSATTGLPQQSCAGHAHRLKGALLNLSGTIAALCGNKTPQELDDYFGTHEASLVRSVAVVLPSNAPGVNGLWFPLLALRTPVALKPGHADPWTPLRLISACVKAGIPAEVFGFYPSDHAGGRALLRSRDAGMIFGNDQTTSPYKDNPNIQRNGPGYSKVIFGADTSAKAQNYLPFLEECVLYNSGRSCTNTSTIVVTSGGKALAKALAARVAEVRPVALENPTAILAGYGDRSVPAAMVSALDKAMTSPGAMDFSRALRGSPPIETLGGFEFLLPTVIFCEDPEHPMAQVEYPFPLVTVVERAENEIEPWLRDSLIVTVISESPTLLSALRGSRKISSLREGSTPTTSGSWQSPHIGNLFELIHAPAPNATKRAQA